MGEAAEHLEPGELEPRQLGRRRDLGRQTLRAVDSTEGETEAFGADDSEPEPYPRYAFEFEDKLFNRLVRPSRETAVRSLTRSLARGCPPYSGFTPDTAVSNLNRHKRFVESVLVRDGRKSRRIDLLPRKQVFSELIPRLRRVNDPTLQVLDQLDGRRGSVISDSEMLGLGNDFVTAIHAETIRRIYDKRLAKKKPGEQQ
jgi:hypothetical protein